MQQLNENGKPIIDDHFIRSSKAEKIMKNAYQAKQTLYVCAPSGFGKTSFIADMLSRRRYFYLKSENTKHLLKTLDEIIESQSNSKESIVVIDDLHNISLDIKDELLLRLEKLMIRNDI